jgi:disulfide bond formation protein DsbB
MGVDFKFIDTCMVCLYIKIIILCAALISLVVLRYNQKYRKAGINMEVEGCQEGQEQSMEMDD